MSPHKCKSRLVSTDSSDTGCQRLNSGSCRGNGVGTYQARGVCPTIPVPRTRFCPLPSCKKCGTFNSCTGDIFEHLAELTHTEKAVAADCKTVALSTRAASTLDSHLDTLKP